MNLTKEEFDKLARLHVNCATYLRLIQDGISTKLYTKRHSDAFKELCNFVSEKIGIEIENNKNIQP